MAPYQSEGSLTTDKRTVDDTETWDAQSGWEAYQSASNVEIVNGAVQLAEQTVPEAITNQWRHSEGTGTVVADSVGSNDADLIGAIWEEDNFRYTYSTVYDGTDDRWETQNEFGINGQNATMIGWVYYQSNADYAPLLSARDFSTGDGWKIDIAPGPVLRVTNQSGGSATHQQGTYNLVSGTWYFLAGTVDGDTTNVYLWDRSSQLDNFSLTASRGQSQTTMGGMGRKDNLNYVEGKVAEALASTSTTMTQTEIANYWEQTR